MSAAHSSLGRLSRPRGLCARVAVATSSVVVLASCIGTTGSSLVTFRAFAAGPADLPPNVAAEGLSFVNGLGWSIRLTRAKLHIGALYLNRSVPVSGGQERECFLPGVYVAQVAGGLDVDALSPTLQPFSETGNGTADNAVTGEVWLTGGPIDAQDDRTIIADVAGSATRNGESIRFEGTVTIGRNRVVANGDPARPGAQPLCSARIVTPVATSITPTDGGSLVVRVDPRGWFRNVELAELAPVTTTSDLRRIPDELEPAPAYNLYVGLRAASGVYRFEWIR